MTLKDLRRDLAAFWAEFRRERSGLAGLGILLLSLAVVALEPLILPWPQASRRWRDIEYWQDNSPSSPPTWTNAFRSRKASVTARLRPSSREEAPLDGGGTALGYSFEYAFSADEPPLDLIFHGRGSGDLPVILSLERPDGESAQLVQRLEQGLADQDIRISIGSDGRDGALAFLRRFESEEALAAVDASTHRPTAIVFAKAGPAMSKEFVPLKGTYRIVARTMLLDPSASRLEEPYLIAAGSVSGLLGTDDFKRDIFSGIVAGLKWALLIGLLTSAASVLVGVLYGIVSAYYGGAVDAAMQFAYQVVHSIPVLPVLIVVSAIFRPSIWFIMVAMVVFFWTGPVMTVRSMTLQIKEETFVEAARAYGSTDGRIIRKQLLPILLPYSFASMALHVPGAIVYESTVSLLGLGDASIVTWGQILHDAVKGGAVLNGIWWWVVPPGLLIATMGMTFAFLGFAMDRILHPKLKTR